MELRSGPEHEADELALTDEQKRILDERLEAEERHPDGWVDWDVAWNRMLAALRR